MKLFLKIFYSKWLLVELPFKSNSKAGFSFYSYLEKNFSPSLEIFKKIFTALGLVDRYSFFTNFAELITTN